MIFVYLHIQNQAHWHLSHQPNKHISLSSYNHLAHDPISIITIQKGLSLGVLQFPPLIFALSSVKFFTQKQQDFQNLQKDVITLPA
jgi:16S rRNA U1498 N3-methylase RsmE